MDNERDSRPERRQHARHQFPLAKGPMLEIEGKTFPILDICERGLRIQTPPGMGFVDGETVNMTIRFAEGDDLARSGTIVRTQDTHVIGVGILLSEAIPSTYFSRE